MNINFINTVNQFIDREAEKECILWLRVEKARRILLSNKARRRRPKKWKGEEDALASTKGKYGNIIIIIFVINRIALNVKRVTHVMRKRENVPKKKTREKIASIPQTKVFRDKREQDNRLRDLHLIKFKTERTENWPCTSPLSLKKKEKKKKKGSILCSHYSRLL